MNQMRFKIGTPHTDGASYTWVRNIAGGGGGGGGKKYRLPPKHPGLGARGGGAKGKGREGGGGGGGMAEINLRYAKPHGYVGL